MLDDSSKNLSLFYLVEGLAEGLSQFSGPSRAAVIFSEHSEDPIRVYDPQGLLEGHEPILKELYLDSEEWRSKGPDPRDFTLPGQVNPEADLKLTGLVSHGGRSRSVFYQMWFTEHHPDTCSTGPTERWLEQAAYLLSHDFAFEEAHYTRSSSHVLREYAVHAVRDYILDEINRMLGWDTKVLVIPILDAALAISKTVEEGFPPRGNLVIVAPQDFSQLQFLARFPRNERPDLRNTKHVRKLLQAVESSEHKLVCDGLNIFGIVTGRMPECRLTMDFRGSYGFVRLAGALVCSFSDGRFYSSNRKANLVDLEEILVEAPINRTLSSRLFRVVSDIVNRAGEEAHGCTLVIDLNEPVLDLPGQVLEYSLDLRRKELAELAQALSKMDGALQIGLDCRLHRFACLLDGLSVPGEDRARGARFNSALRFSARQENLVVIVVSADRPVSIIKGGVEITARCELKPFTKMVKPPPTMKQWIGGN